MSDHTNWIITGSPDNFQATKNTGFSVQGLKSRHIRKAEKIRPGDRVTWYITGQKTLAGTATVTSEYFEDHTPIWSSKNKKMGDEDYPYRFNIKPDIILEDDEFIDAEPVARQLKYVQKWPPKNWTLAFQGNIRPVEDDDFAIIEDALKDASRVTSGD